MLCFRQRMHCRLVALQILSSSPVHLSALNLKGSNGHNQHCVQILCILEKMQSLVDHTLSHIHGAIKNCGRGRFRCGGLISYGMKEITLKVR